MSQRRVGRLESKGEVLTDTVGAVKVELAPLDDKLDRKASRVTVRQPDRRVATLETKQSEDQLGTTADMIAGAMNVRLQ